MPESGHFDGDIFESGLFDFQEAAVQFCLEKLRMHQRVAVLGLGRGMGKRTVAREIAARGLLDEKHDNNHHRHDCNRRAAAAVVIMFCSGARVEQTACILRQAAASTTTTAFTTRVVAIHKASDIASSSLRQRQGVVDILVINWTLKLEETTRHNHLEDIKLAVIDEAHEIPTAAAKRCIASMSRRGCSSCSSSCPLLLLSSEPHLLAHLAWRSPGDSKHVNAQSLRIRMEALWARAFVVSKTPRLAIAIGASVPRVLKRNLEVSLMESHVYQSRLEELGASAVVSLPIKSGSLSSLRSLHDKHMIAWNHAKLWRPPWNHLEGLPQTVKVMLATFEYARDVEKALEDFPLHDSKQQKVQIIHITQSSTRSTILKRLPGLRLQMTALKQAKGALRRVLMIGSDWFIEQLWHLLFPRLTVIIGSQNAIAAYDFHNTIDSVWLPNPPFDVSSIYDAVDEHSKISLQKRHRMHHVNVIVDVHKDTLDVYFAQRCSEAAAREFQQHFS